MHEEVYIHTVFGCLRRLFICLLSQTQGSSSANRRDALTLAGHSLVLDEDHRE
jgi:hypothetical protein